jgi:hypothetical protein
MGAEGGGHIAFMTRLVRPRPGEVSHSLPVAKPLGYASAPVDDFGAALAAVRDLREAGIISDYAVGGAMAHAFWSEPTTTFDLDVFVLLQSTGILTDLGPIYRWAKDRGYPVVAEHIVIAGIPVQLIPAYDLASEAVAKAAELDYDGKAVRVITPEYLIAMYLQPSARTSKRLARVGGLLDEGNVDQDLLKELLERYNLELPRQ